MAANATEEILVHRGALDTYVAQTLSGNRQRHGNTEFDVVDVSTTWRPADLESFQRLIAAGIADVVMVAHVLNRQLDPAGPASLSAAVVTDLLRGQPGWAGAIVSDHMQTVAISSRYGRRMHRGPVPDVVSLLEERGIVVIRSPLQSADVDAFSLPFADRPVVVLGADKNDRARSRFDAAHELGHLTIHGEQIWGMAEIEKQAHMFAAAFLMPADEIRAQLPATVDWPKLFDLKRDWQVSLAALLMRARTLTCMSEATYLTAIKAASAHGWRRVEPVPLGLPEQPQRLLALIHSAASRTVLTTLPADIVTEIASASAA